MLIIFSKKRNLWIGLLCLSFNFRQSPPPRWVPCWLTANYWWWLDHNSYYDVSKSCQTAIWNYFSLSALWGEEEDQIKELWMKKKCAALHPFEWPSHRLWDLIWWLIRFDLTWPFRGKRSSSAAKWGNNCASQHRLWSIHFDATSLAGRDGNVLAERKHLWLLTSDKRQ